MGGWNCLKHNYFFFQEILPEDKADFLLRESRLVWNESWNNEKYHLDQFINKFIFSLSFINNSSKL